MAVAPAEAHKTSSPPLPKPPLVQRLKAWWEGYDLVPRHKQDVHEAPARAPAGPIVMPNEVRGWPAQRIAAAQLMFGEDFTWPGEEGALDLLFKPLGLNEKMSVLELGAGLGGGSRLMAKSYGAWVNAVERDGGLATAGNSLSTKHGLARKAPVTFAEYTELPVREHTIDAIVCRQALSTVEDQDALLGKLVTLFKPAGQLLVSDLTVADASVVKDPAYAAWLAAEPSPVHLWDAGRLRASIEKHGLEVRVTEDCTASLRTQVLGAFAETAGLLADMSIDPGLRGWILWETELWARRLQMMERGMITMHRIYATATIKV